MQRLFMLGVNHRTASLELREKLAFSNAQLEAALIQFREKFPDCEAVLLSTCNRVELYVAKSAQGHPDTDQAIDFLSSMREVSALAIKPHIYEKSERIAVEHLFSVASSLDSMVLGETQVLGQVRQAYDRAADMRLTGAILNPLFQKAIAVGKQVLSATPLAEGRMSLASVAVAYARRIFESFSDKTVLSIGAGKMAQLVIRHFAELRPKSLLICNRDREKADALALVNGGSPVSFENLSDHLTLADIVVTSTGAQHPIITRKTFDGIRKARRYRPIFLIDIAVPRDIEPAVGEIENVYLYNLDDLQQVISQTQASRSDTTALARQIVAGHVEEFSRWHRARELGPVIDQLYRRYHELARGELSRTLGKLPNVSNAEKQHLEDLTRRIVNKLLHDPIKRLKESDSMHQASAQYIHALEKLFQLDEHPDSEGAPIEPANP